MRTLPARGYGLAALLILLPGLAAAQNIYKCTVHGQLTYTDQPCPAGTGELLHQASDVETIDYYLSLGQAPQAEAWAKARHLEPLYQQRVALRDATLKAKAEKADAEALAEQRQAAAQRDQARTQAMQAVAAAQVAHNTQLEAENAALRQQNTEYQSDLNRPVYVPVYQGRPYPSGHRIHDGNAHDNHHPHSQPPAVSDKPQFTNCINKAGGRVEC